MSAMIPAIGDGDWETCRLMVPREQIAYVTAIFEGFDNEFLVRTEEKGLGFLRVWYARHARANLDAVLREMAGEFPFDIVSFTAGMDGLEEIYPE